MSKTIYIFEPALAKSKAMAKLLQTSLEPINVAFVAMDEAEREALGGGMPLWADIKPLLNADSVLLPTGIISTELVLRQSVLQRGGVKVDQTVLDVCHKPWLLAQARKAGVPVPVTWQRRDDITAFPVFYKEEYEAGGGIRGIAHHANELPNLENKSLIFQEFIQSQGTYGVAFWAENGEIKAQVSHFEQYSLPASGGSAVYIERFDDPRLLQHAQTLLAALSYSGWGLVEFKYDPKRQDYVLMEINSKIWASIEFSLRNSPALAQYFLGAAVDVKPLASVVFWDNFVQREWSFIGRHLGLLFKPVISYDGVWQSIKRRLTR